MTNNEKARNWALEYKLLGYRPPYPAGVTPAELLAAQMELTKTLCGLATAYAQR